MGKGKKGSEADIVAVLGWVGDFDDPRAHEWASRLPVEPSLVIESSRGRFQPFLLYKTPVEPAVAKRVAGHLKARADCDHGSADISHVWRIPGTWNWPNVKKLAAGRSPDPQSVTVAREWNERLFDLAELVPVEVLTAPSKPSRTRTRPNGSPAEGEGPSTPAETEPLIATLPQDLRDLLSDQTAPDRSQALYRIVRQLTGLGLAASKIEAILDAHPNGPAAKYADRDDLADEIARIQGKVHEPPPADPGGSSGNIEPEAPAPKPEVPRGNGQDPEGAAEIVDLIVEPGSGGGDGGGGDGGGGGGGGEGGGEGGEGGGEGAGGDEPDDESDDGSEKLSELTAEENERRRQELIKLSREILQSMNRRYFVLSETGQVWVGEWRPDHTFESREVLNRISFDDFRKLYLNRTIKAASGKGANFKVVRRNLGEWWLRHPARRQYGGGVVFDPSGMAPPDCLNLWRGFAVKDPQPGDWSLLRDHIFKIICSGDAEHFEYLMNWLARLVQYPEEPGQVAVVLRGGKGVGKGILGHYLVKLFAQHGLQITQAVHLTGKFNAHLHDCCFLFADEAFFAGDKQHEGTLKGLITEATLVIEPKRRNVIVVRNRLHALLASNNDWVVPASVDERRFFVLDVVDTRAGDLAYFAAIVRQMDDRGLGAMLYELQHRDIRGFEVRAVPTTTGLRTQKTLSLPTIERWWMTVLERGFLWKSRHGTPWFNEWSDFYTSELLWRSYVQWCSEAGPRSRQGRTDLGRFFTKVAQATRLRGEHPIYEVDSIDHGELHPSPLSGQRAKTLDEIAIVYQDHPRGYQVGDLEEARDAFAKHHDIDLPWR